MLYVIARIGRFNDKKQWINEGYKIYNTKSGDFKSLTVSEIKQRKLNLENAVVEGTELKGTQGDLERYTCLSSQNMRLLDNPTMVILGKDSDGNYIVIARPDRTDNMISIVSPYELKREVDRNNKFEKYDRNGVLIANAAVKNKDNFKSMIISALSGSFDDNILIKYPNFIQQTFEFDEDEQMSAIKNWMVRIVKKGQPYGLNYCLTHDKDEPLVEFYSLGDYRLPDEKGTLKVDEQKKQELRDKFPIGQFVSRYNLRTVLDHTPGVGLDLYGSEPRWTLYGDSFGKIINWIKGSMHNI